MVAINHHITWSTDLRRLAKNLVSCAEMYNSPTFSGHTHPETDAVITLIKNIAEYDESIPADYEFLLEIGKDSRKMARVIQQIDLMVNIASSETILDKWLLSSEVEPYGSAEKYNAAKGKIKKTSSTNPRGAIQDECYAMLAQHTNKFIIIALEQAISEANQHYQLKCALDNQPSTYISDSYSVPGSGQQLARLN